MNLYQEEEISVLEIVFGESAAMGLSFSFAKGRENDVLCFSSPFSMGEIDEDGIGEKRRETLRCIFRGDDEKKAEDLFKKDRENLSVLIRRAKNAEPIRVWSGETPDEVCGAYFIIEQLSRIGSGKPDVALVKLPDFYERADGTAVRYIGFGEVEPELFGEFAKKGKKLPYNIIIHMAEHWRALRKENASLRAVINGKLVSVSENIYDKYILGEIALQQSEFCEASVIGSVISKYQLGIGDDFIARRIEKFIGDGTLEFTGNKSGRGRIYNRILRKCT